MEAMPDRIKVTMGEQRCHEGESSQEDYVLYGDRVMVSFIVNLKILNFLTSLFSKHGSYIGKAIEIKDTHHFGIYNQSMFQNDGEAASAIFDA